MKNLCQTGIESPIVGEIILSCLTILTVMQGKPLSQNATTFLKYLAKACYSHENNCIEY